MQGTRHPLQYVYSDFSCCWYWLKVNHILQENKNSTSLILLETTIFKIFCFIMKAWMSQIPASTV
jgi:hypothetical protein